VEAWEKYRKQGFKGLFLTIRTAYPLLMRGVGVFFLLLYVLQLVCFFISHIATRTGTRLVLYIYAHTHRHTPSSLSITATHSHAQPHQWQDAGQWSYQFNYKSSHSSENKRNTHRYLHRYHTQPTQGIS